MLAVGRGALAAPRPLKKVVVTATPGAVELGGSGPQDIALRISLMDADGKPVAPVGEVLAYATAGHVGALESVGVGAFRALLTRPEQTFPQIAVVTVAAVAGDATTPPIVGTAVVGFSAHLDLRGRTEPGAKMRVEVGGTRFGPVTAASDGRFVLPIVVPPGEGFGRGVSTDPLGNASSSRINLYLPEVQRLHAFIYPSPLIANGVDAGWCFITTVDAAGAPEVDGFAITQARGQTQAAEILAPGLYRVAYRAPRSVGAGNDTLLVKARSHNAVYSVAVPLMAGPPSRIALDIQPGRLPADGRATAVAQVSVRDAVDNPVDVGRAWLVVDGAEVSTARRAPGVYEAVLPARTAMGTADVVGVASGVAADCSHFRHAAWGRVDRQGLTCDASPALLQAHQTVHWQMAAPLSLGLQLVRREGAAIYLALTAAGLAAPAERLQISASRGALRIVQARPGALELVLTPGDGSGPIDIVASDQQTGVSAWLRVP